MALLAAPLLAVLGLILTGCNLQPPWPWCPLHQAPVLTDVSLELPWDMVAHVAAGSPGDSKTHNKAEAAGQPASWSFRSEGKN